MSLSGSGEGTGLRSSCGMAGNCELRSMCRGSTSTNTTGHSMTPSDTITRAPTSRCFSTFFIPDPVCRLFPAARPARIEGAEDRDALARSRIPQGPVQRIGRMLADALHMLPLFFQQRGQVPRRRASRHTGQACHMPPRQNCRNWRES